MIRPKLVWIPRILAIVFIIFLFIFDLAVMFCEQTWAEGFICFLIHLIPSLLLGTILVISWHRPQLAGWGFLLTGLAFAGYIKSYSEVFGYLVVLFPTFIGAMFFIFHVIDSKNHSQQKE